MAASTRSKSVSPRKKKTRSDSASRPATPQKAKATRKPRHCLKCPDRPLLSTCEHRFRKRQIPAATTPGVQTPANDDAPVMVNPIPPPSDPFLEVVDPILVEEDMRSGCLPPLVATAHLPGNVTASPVDRNVTPSPTLVSSPAPPHTPVSPATTVTSTIEASTPGSLPEPLNKAVKEKRRQPSGTYARFGKVEGAGRGNDVWDLYRVRHLKPPIKEQAEATRKLERWTIDLMSRAESISTRTGCWLYLAIQHPASKTPFAHYVSRKLRNDAPEDVAIIHKEVRQTMNNLTRAHKRGLFEAEKEVQEAKAQADIATKRAEQAENELTKLKRLLVAQGISLTDQ
ncbi:hypothetical protein CC2G_012414 [Coprinopsis cinerea AmutBmut pab1-1]|nr:hypothetical protein CC2G_012414 [Coprinopsis cinerea AmutBmut pab1-1]